MISYKEKYRIPFNKSFIAGSEIEFIKEAIDSRNLSGDGPFTTRCHDWLRAEFNGSEVLLTHSATAALEMAAILLDIGVDDEVVIPSYTFVSSVNAFVLRGATPVFVDICPETQNISVTGIENAITNRTKAILVVHYAGVACDMHAIQDLAKRHDLNIIEDSAQGIKARHGGVALGNIGSVGCVSFHETKNVSCGEGGAIIVNDRSLIDRARIIREKGTNRTKFKNGEVDKYTWCDIGSSYLPNELTAAYLFAQLQVASEITRRRLDLWTRYDEFFKPNAQNWKVKTPKIPEYAKHNGHIYYLIFDTSERAGGFIEHCASFGIQVVRHYTSLHDSLGAASSGSITKGSLPNTVTAATQLVRLPLWPDLDSEMDYVLTSFENFFQS